MVLVPHEDDDLAVAGQMIYAAMQNKQKIKVVFTTNGDYYKKEGAIRIREAKRALGVLGVDEKDIIFLGYGDSVHGNVHLYNAPENETVCSFNGNDETYGTEDTPEFSMAEYGVHHSFTRANYKNDLKSVVKKYLPDILITTDWDNHMDHLALSLMLDEILGELLKEEVEYRPLVLKGLAYNGKWEGRADYYEAENITENYNAAIGTERVHPLNKWDERIRFKAPEKCDTPLLKNNILYKAACEYRSQSADLKGPQFINRDVVYWRRPTESLTYRAKFYGSSGEVSFLNDFKCADCSDIVYGADNYDKGIWIPDIADEKKQVTIVLEKPEYISEIHLFESSYTGGRITNVKIALNGNESVFNSGELLHDGGRTVIMVPEEVRKRIRAATIELQVESFEGGKAGLTEIEVYGERKALEQYALPLPIWENERDLPRKQSVPFIRGHAEQIRYHVVKYGRVRIWPWKYFLMKTYPKLNESDGFPVFFKMHICFLFQKLFEKIKKRRYN